MSVRPDVDTELCVTPKPMPMAEIKTCYEWWRHYWLPVREKEAA